MAVEGQNQSLGGGPAQEQMDGSAAKRVRFEETQGGGEVRPLKEIDTSVDVNKLSGTQINEQLTELYRHAEAKQCSPDQLPPKERNHFFRLNITLDDRAQNAKRFFEEMVTDGDMDQADAHTWVKMLDDNAMNPLARNNIATYAACSRERHRKADDQRKAAEKRALDAEDALEKLKASQTAQQKPASTSFQQQIKTNGGGGTNTSTVSDKPKAANAYYNKFPLTDNSPFGGRGGSNESSSFSAIFSEATLRWGNAPQQQG